MLHFGTIYRLTHMKVPRGSTAHRVTEDEKNRAVLQTAYREIRLIEKDARLRLLVPGSEGKHPIVPSFYPGTRYFLLLTGEHADEQYAINGIPQQFVNQPMGLINTFA